MNTTEEWAGVARSAAIAERMRCVFIFVVGGEGSVKIGQAKVLGMVVKNWGVGFARLEI